MKSQYEIGKKNTKKKSTRIYLCADRLIVIKNDKEIVNDIVYVAINNVTVTDHPKDNEMKILQIDYECHVKGNNEHTTSKFEIHAEDSNIEQAIKRMICASNAK